MRTGQESPTATYSRLSTQYNVPSYEEQLGTFRTQVAKTKDLIDRLEEDINKRTEGKLVNEAQRRRMISAEQAPLTTSLGRLGTGQQVAAEGLRSALGNVETGLRLTSSEQERQLEPFKMRASMMSDRLAREATGYAQQKQTELSLLLDGLERKRTLTDQEWARAAELSKSERDWANEKEKIRLQMEADIRKSIAVKNAGGGDAGLAKALANELRGGAPATAASVTSIPEGDLGAHSAKLNSIFSL